MLFRYFYVKKLTNFFIRKNLSIVKDMYSDFFGFFLFYIKRKQNFSKICKYYKKSFSYETKVTIKKRGLNVKKNLYLGQFKKYIYSFSFGNFFFFSKMKFSVFFSNIKLLSTCFSKRLSILWLFYILNENFFSNSLTVVQLIGSKNFLLLFLLNFLNRLPTSQSCCVEKKIKTSVSFLIYPITKNERSFTFTKQKKVYLRNIFVLKKIIKKYLKNRLVKKKSNIRFFFNQTIFQVFFYDFFYDFNTMIMSEKKFNFSKIFDFFSFKPEYECYFCFGCISGNIKLYYSRFLYNFHSKKLLKTLV
nr:hypothetical protein CparaKRNrm3_p124 [Cryptomonas paramecium]